MLKVILKIPNFIQKIFKTIIKAIKINFQTINSNFTQQNKIEKFQIILLNRIQEIRVSGIRELKNLEIIRY